MGVSDDSTTVVARGVERTDCWWGYVFRGSKDQLIESGLVPLSWFVDENERDERGRRRRSKCFHVDGREVRTREPARGPCRVIVYFSEEECRAIKYRDALRDARAEEAKNIAQLPTTHEQYRRETVEFMKRWLWGARSDLSIGVGGYRFAPEVIEAFDAAAADIVQMLAEGRSVFNSETHNACLAQIKAKTARLDPGLQRFLNDLGIKQ